MESTHQCVRTRFAPSPTGMMHVGNLRTALYAWLWARSQNGCFILRIEDTDQKRYVEGAVDAVYRTLAAAGLDDDEGPDVGGDYGPYIQSERKAIYEKYAHELVERGAAYYCFCEKNRDETEGEFADESEDPCRELSPDIVRAYLEADRPHVIRQRIPKTGVTAYKDMVFGNIQVENRYLDDQILLKSDGMPTYNFANVVDDHLMAITHVIRGADFLSSTPKYQLLYEAFGWASPQYAHLPLIMGQNADGSCSKLSKRHGAVSFEQLVEEGYLPEAVVNYIALLGWSPGDDREKLSLEEIRTLFDLKDVNCSQAIFDYQKLSWLNGEYMKELSDADFCRRAYPFIAHLSEKVKAHWLFIGGFLKTRVRTLKESAEKIAFIDDLPEYETELFRNKRNKVTLELAYRIVTEMTECLTEPADEEWTFEHLDEIITEYCESRELKKGAVMWPLRIALAGQPVTPMGTPEILFVLEKTESLCRLKIARDKLEIYAGRSSMLEENA